MWQLIYLLIGIGVADASDKNFISFGSFICPRDDKALGRCLKDVLNTYLPEIAGGVPKHAIPPCEPLVIPSLEIKQTAGPISVLASYTDVTVRGPSKMRVKDFDIQSSKRKIIVKLYIPELRMKGDYKLKGQILMLPIEGEGQFTAKYGNIDAIVTITLARVPRESAPDALTCDTLDVKFHTGSASINLDNLFSGDNDMGSEMNQFLNDNWQSLSEELQEPIEQALRGVLKPIADLAFGTLNADDILPPEEF